MSPTIGDQLSRLPRLALIVNGSGAVAPGGQSTGRDQPGLRGGGEEGQPECVTQNGASHQ